MITTIQIESKLKVMLDKLKIHHRESYNELLYRLINNSSPKNVDRESLIETIDVLSDPEAMRDIAEAMENLSNGNYGKPISKIKKEFSLKNV